MKNSKYNNSKKNSMSLMMGYCSVLIAVACILMIGFFVVSHISSEEIERSSARLVLQVRELCDEAASEAETLAFRIFNIPSVSKLASTKYNDRKNVGDHVKNIHSELVTALEISKITDEMYVVIKDADICVNSSAKFNLKIFYEVYFSAYFSSYDECMDTLFHFDGDYKKYITLKNANGELTTVFVCRPLG